MRQPVVATVLSVAAIAAGCGWGPAAPPGPPQDKCTETDGPSPDTVRRAIAAVPVAGGEAVGSAWVETAGGHTRNCRLYWVKLAPADATAASPEQLLFFDHDTPLGSPTPDPRPYTTVLSSGRDTVTVQYQWRVGDEPPCCPDGIGTTRYQIGSGGRLKALDPIPGRPRRS